MLQYAVVEDTLRQADIHAKYRDGSFEAVTETLEAFQQTHKAFLREDSIFLAKHLAVVYASNPARREKGKYYMRRLLEADPSATLMDMYVGDEIDRVWEKVRAEFFAARGGPPMAKSPTLSPNEVAAARRDEPAARKGNSTLKVAAWTGAGLVGAGVVAYFLLSGGETGGNTFTIDARADKP